MEIHSAFLRPGHPLRPGTRITPTSLTIHNTGNPRSTAANERAWLDNPVNLQSGTFASWHYVIDETTVIQAIPEDEMSFHAQSGNGTSLGIEICESGNQHVVWRRAVQFVASLLQRMNWGVERVRTHRDWTGKNCPRLILPEWSRFIRDVNLARSENTLSTTITISMNGIRREFAGVTAAGRSMVALRPLLEQLGYHVIWQQELGIVEIGKTVAVLRQEPEQWSHDI